MGTFAAGGTAPVEALEYWARQETERGLVYLDPLGRISSWTEMAERITGYGHAEAVGRAWADLSSGAVDSGGATTTTLRRRDGTSIAIELTSAPLHRDGALIGFALILWLGKDESAEHLRLREARYRAWIDYAADALFTHREGMVIDVNERACESLGYSREELIGMMPWHFDPDVTPAQLEDLAARMANGDTVAFDSRHRRKDGSTFPVEVRMRMFVSKGVRHGFAVVRDITERKRTEQRLRASEERFEFALRGANDGIWDWNLVTDDVVFSSRWKSMLGYADEELLDKVSTWRLLVHPEDLPSAEEKVRQYLAGEIDRYEVEFRMAHKAGGHRNVLARGYLVSDENRLPVRFVGTHVDITDRKQAEMLLRRSEEALRRAQSIAHVTSWAFDIATGTLSPSEEGKRLMGRPDGDYTMEDFLGCVHPDDRPLVEGAWRAAVVDAAAYELEHRLIVGGVVKWVYVRATTDRDAAGRPNTVVGVTQDVTVRRRLEEQIQQVQKMEAVGQLAGGIAHDFNNILVAILAYASMIGEELGDNHPLAADVREIATAGQRAAGLTQQLLTFSRRQPVRFTVLELNPIVDRVHALLTRVLGEDVRLVTNRNQSHGSIEADATQLEQLLINLAVNARDAMPNGGTLRISTSNVDIDGALAGEVGIAPGPCVLLSVSDTGCGMDAATRSRIFEPFFTTKDVGKGTGLGLAIVFGIVKESGGGVAVQSEPGRGSTFNVYFPRVLAAPEKSGGSERKPRGPRGTETVLVVEDDDQVRAVVRRMLGSSGYDVLLAPTARSALEILSERADVALVLTDLVMPDLDGHTMAAQIRHLHPKVKLVFMSGYTEHPAIRRAALGPTEAFIQKPFVWDEVLGLVRRVLDGP